MKTVIEKAKQLRDEVGTEEAIKYFENRISNIGIPKSFADYCKITAAEVAIFFLKNELEDFIKSES